MKYPLLIFLIIDQSLLILIMTNYLLLNQDTANLFLAFIFVGFYGMVLGMVG